MFSNYIPPKRFNRRYSYILYFNCFFLIYLVVDLEFEMHKLKFKELKYIIQTTLLNLNFLNSLIRIESIWFDSNDYLWS